ncbi:hypothetical protein I3F58_24615 [Streptomyces sp. MUM 203J]|uniref:hypothetical protein n=1 Tax=Streptomyces sp. MUM 203J TaxID=2791990 RepID=UPI001F0407A9|nr:hypothetical protein [Streptomyces sp. MUM 203J]MCH0542685.1 hypothetical protein [Streptomyces sp. MUM 203J]
MPQKISSAAVAATLAVCLSGCIEAPPPDTSPERNAFTPLSELEVIAVSDNPLEAIGSFPGEEPVKILAEVKQGPYRILAYASESSCGLTSSSDGAGSGKTHLASKWPTGENGATLHPGGPYNISSSDDGFGFLISMACGRNAMVIQYRSAELRDSGEAESRGHVSVDSTEGQSATSRIVVGGQKVRERIATQAEH